MVKQWTCFETQNCEAKQRWGSEKKKKKKTWALDIFSVGFGGILPVIKPEAKQKQNDYTKCKAC